MRTIRAMKFNRTLQPNYDDFANAGLKVSLNLVRYFCSSIAARKDFNNQLRRFDEIVVFYYRGPTL